MSDDLTSIMLSMVNSDETREKYQKSLFGYQGNKFRMLDKILPHLPYRKIYVEPFGGTGIVLINRKPSKLEVFNDRYSGMTDFYRVIRDKDLYPKLIERMKECVHSREEFIWCRDTWKDLTDDKVERAARWYYSVKMSFGKQGRNFGRATKTSGAFTRALHDCLSDFHIVHRRLCAGGGVQLENIDFRYLLKDHDTPESVYYLDPPYFDCFETYEKDLTKEEHKEMLERVFDMQSFVAISGYPNELYNKYPWDNVIQWDVKEMTKGYAFTDSNHQIFDGHKSRQMVREALYIKEAKDD